MNGKEKRASQGCDPRNKKQVMGRWLILGASSPRVKAARQDIVQLPRHSLQSRPRDIILSSRSPIQHVKCIVCRPHFSSSTLAIFTLDYALFRDHALIHSHLVCHSQRPRPKPARPRSKYLDQDVRVKDHQSPHSSTPFLHVTITTDTDSAGDSSERSFPQSD